MLRTGIGCSGRAARADAVRLAERALALGRYSSYSLFSWPFPYRQHATTSGIRVLELAFANKELRSACEDAAYAEAAYGPVIAQALVGRLADLRAASDVLELPFAEIRPSSMQEPEHVAVALPADRVLIVGVGHVKPPLKPDGTIAWERVSRVIILRIA